MTNKEIEQYLTVRNYKEPLRRIPKNAGFGFYGAIRQTLDGDKVECHICGKLCTSLASHIRYQHKTNVRVYREEFNLARETALISDDLRERKKQITMDYRSGRGKKGLKEREKRRIIEIKKVWAKRKKEGWSYHHKQSLETQNKRGACPDQILAKITEVAEKMGRTPSIEEFVKYLGSQRYRYLITKVYGSWLNALKLLKMQPKGHYSLGRKPKYSDEELLEYLETFAKTNRKIPTFSDFKRKYLPGFKVYTQRFGSIEKARQLAGVYKYVTKEQINNVYKFARNVKRKHYA